MNVNARFLPWVRQATFSGDAILVRAAGRDVSVPISRYGPGDVTGLAAGQISRRDPAPGSLSMPPNLFVSVEFSRADLPWALSPGLPDANGRLQPWLALIAIEAPAGNPLGSIADAKLPVMEVSRNELPAPAELSLWAHVQVDASIATTEDVIRGGVARILSPHALAPKRRYLACLVPTFEAGRLAGLGKDVPDARSTVAAWSTGPGTVVLPVYDSWFFTTADSEDLETIAQRLRGYDLSATSRPKQLDVSRVSGNVAGKLAPFEGALRPVGPLPEWSGPAVANAAKLLGSQLEHTPIGGIPVVGPPVYGSIASGQTKPVPGWLNDLNLDPRWRAAAGLGVDMVRQHQEDLVDEAWRQAGDIQRARREHGGALLAEFVAARLNARMIAPLGGANALVTMAPALPRMRDAASTTAAARVKSSVMPEPVLDAAFRRILATKAPLAARKAGQGIRRSVALQNTLTVLPGALPYVPAKLVTKAKISLAMRAGAWPMTLVSGTTGERPLVTEAEPIARLITPAAAQAAATTVTPAQQAMISAFIATTATRKPAVVEVITPKALVWLTPSAPIDSFGATARFAARVTFGDGARLNQATGVVATPRFTQPLSAWLDPSYLLSGIDIPNDAAGLLAVNSDFVEALIVGANHELARELLWRGVPLDRTSTLLARFFETRMSSAPRDVIPVSEWKPEDRLGSHISFGERSIMILRSRLVSHLSETVIFLANAEPDGPFRKPGSTQMLPLFRGFAGLDTAYFGFEISPEEMASDPGWYFVIQELSGATRFGLDEVAPATMSTWNDLAWPNVSVAGGYIVVSQLKPAPVQPRGLEWGRDAGHMAAITLQRPIRISIHTSLLMPKKS